MLVAAIVVLVVVVLIAIILPFHSESTTITENSDGTSVMTKHIKSWRFGSRVSELDIKKVEDGSKSKTE